MNDQPENETKRSRPPVELQFGSFRIRLQQAFSIIVALVGIMSGIIAAMLGSRGVESGKQIVETTTAIVERAIDQSKKDSKTEVVALRDQVKAVESQLSKMATIPSDSAVAVKLLNLEQSLSNVTSRLGKLEQVILQDPPKALEMPLFRNQLDSMKTGYQSEILSVKQEIAQVYDLSKWFIGLMCTMAMGIVGLAITNFLKSSKKDD